jgi:Uncharacterized conserved protein
MILLTIPPQAIGITAGIFSAISLVPQLTKLIKEKKPQDVSMLMFVTLLVGLALWIVYGIAKQDWPIICTNSFSLLVNTAIIILNTKYKQKAK